MREPVHVLLADDDHADVLMIRAAFDQSAIPVKLHVVRDGEQAIRFARQTFEYASAPAPSLILLDISLPDRDGLAVLAELKSEHGRPDIPVVMLTASHAREDIRRPYSLHANAYITKPGDFDGLAAAIAQIASFFLVLVQTPR